MLSPSHRWRYRITPLQVSLWMQTKPPTNCQKRRHIFVSSSFPFLKLYLLRVRSPEFRFLRCQRHISRVAVWVDLKGRNKPWCSTIGMAGRPIIETLLSSAWNADIVLIIVLSNLNGRRNIAKAWRCASGSTAALLKKINYQIYSLCQGFDGSSAWSKSNGCLIRTN